MNTQALLRSGPPTALVTTSGWRDIVTLQIDLESAHPNTGWLHLRGTRMRTVSGFFDELAAAFQLPVWFGCNWDALVDSARDRAWLAGTIVAIYDAHLLLADATDLDRTNLAEVLTRCNRNGKEVDPTDVPADDEDGFHLVCQVPADEQPAFLARWQAATLTLADLELAPSAN